MFFLDVGTLAYALTLFGEGSRSKHDMYLYTTYIYSPKINVHIFSAPITLSQVKNSLLCQAPDIFNILDFCISNICDLLSDVIRVP